MIFVIKKFVSQFLMPVPLIIELSVVGLLLSCFSRTRRVGRCLTACAFVLFLVCSYGFGFGSYLRWLEGRYPPVELDASGLEAWRGASIVVLGQGVPEESDLPVRFQLSARFQQRLQEGVRLYRKIPGASLYVSLAGDADIRIKERFINDYAQEHGLRREGIHLITAARDTADEARYAVGQAKTNVLLVVTSASHLPRAIKIFSKELKRRGLACVVVPGGRAPDTGTRVASGAGGGLVPVPCDYLFTTHVAAKRSWWTLPLPSVDGLCVTQCALYEGLGNLFEDLVK